MTANVEQAVGEQPQQQQQQQQNNNNNNNSTDDTKRSEELLEFIKTCALQVLEAEKALVHLVSSEEDATTNGLADLQYQIETSFAATTANGESKDDGDDSSSPKSISFFPRLSGSSNNNNNNNNKKKEKETKLIVLSPEKAMSLAIRSLNGSVDYFENECDIANSKIGNLESQLVIKEQQFQKRLSELQREMDLLQLRNQDLNHICDSQTKQLNRMHSCMQDYYDDDDDNNIFGGNSGNSSRNSDANNNNNASDKNTTTNNNNENNTTSNNNTLHQHESNQIQLQLEIEIRQKEELVLRVQKLEDQIADLEHSKEALNETCQQQYATISKLERANRYKRFDGQQEEIAQSFVVEDAKAQCIELQKTLLKYQKEQQDNDTKINVMRQEWDFTEKRMQRATAERDALDVKCREQGAELVELQGELEELQQDFMELQEEHDGICEDYEAVTEQQKTTMETLQKVTSRLEQLEDEKERMDVKIQSQSHVISVLTSEKNKLEQYPEKEALEKCIAHMKEHVEALEDDVEQINVQSNILKLRMKEMEKEKEQRLEETKERQVEMKHLTHQVHELEAERNRLLEEYGVNERSAGDKKNMSGSSLDFLSM